MKIISVVGTRPNFMKIAPFIKAVKTYNDNIKNKNNQIEHLLINTGQHYDQRMSSSFIEELSINDSNIINLNIGAGTHSEQVGKTMIAFEKVLISETPNWVVVVGDVNATLACSIATKKLNIKLCHIEAGLRSNDLSMPEEINRVLTDRISDLLLSPDENSCLNLINEGISKERIKFVGNIMIDTLDKSYQFSKNLSFIKILKSNFHIGFELEKIAFNETTNFGIITLHRPSNVDNKIVLKNLIQNIINVSNSNLKFIWPVHPRTLFKLKEFNLLKPIANSKNILLTHPLKYTELLNLNIHSKFIITDSGGLQEECCVLGTPFFLFRNNTERPITLKENGGTGYIVNNNFDLLKTKLLEIYHHPKNGVRPKYWDGNVAKRCLDAILNFK
jgi:UDP-N-acetylglucosamine 2-epimerase (non-hydrolysing)